MLPSPKAALGTQAPFKIMTNTRNYSMCGETIFIHLLFCLFIWEEKEVQNLSTGDGRQKKIAWNWSSLGMRMQFGGISKMICSQQNTIMFLKWTENTEV